MATSDEDAAVKSDYDIPGTSGYPIVGETGAFIADVTTFISRRFDDHGALFRTNLFGTPTVVACSHQHAQSVLSHRELSPCAMYSRLLDGVYPSPNFVATDDHDELRMRVKAFLRVALNPDILDIPTPSFDNVEEQRIEKVEAPSGSGDDEEGRESRREKEREKKRKKKRTREKTPRDIGKVGETLTVPVYKAFKGPCEQTVIATIVGRQNARDHGERIRKLTSKQLNGVLSAPVVGRARRAAGSAGLELQALLTNMLQNDCGDSINDGTKSVLGHAMEWIQSDRLRLEEASSALVLLLSSVTCKAVISTTATSLLHYVEECCEGKTCGTRNSSVTDIITETLRLYPPIAMLARDVGHTPWVLRSSALSSSSSTIDSSSCCSSPSPSSPVFVSDEDGSETDDSRTNSGPEEDDDDKKEGREYGVDYRLAPTSRVFVSVKHVNRDSCAFAQADRFLPERWRGWSETESATSTGTQGRQTRTHSGEGNERPRSMSFGAGGRGCDGEFLAMRVCEMLLTQFIRTFDIRLDESRGRGDWRKSMKQFPVVRVADDVCVKVARRN